LVVYCVFLVVYCVFLVAYCVFMVAYCVFLVAYCVFLVAYCVFLVAYCVSLIPYCVFLVAYCVLLVAYCVFLVAHCVFSNVYLHICKSPKFTQISISLHRPHLVTIQTSFRCHEPVVHLYDLLFVNCFCHEYSRNTAHLKLENNQSINKDKIS
jgi:hypothetical protein